ncbi:MAG TPA: hypothetical protein VM888_03185 [Chitinophagaceae bacterium]|nr:hypothetical protein [Chitinophagaceae bacterium]
MRHVCIFWILLVTASFAACNNPDVESDAIFDAEALFFDYSISGDEGSGEVTCLVQYHYGGPDGETVFLPSPASVRLDNETITADTSQMSGAFYEVRKGIEEFEGKHSITFTDLDNRKYTESFEFTPFRMESELEPSVRRSDLNLQFSGIKEGDAIRVLLIDTSFATDDINEVINVQNSGIIITKERLVNVTNGPVTLQLFKEEEREIKNTPKGGGKLSVTYGLSKEFDLID